MPNETQLSALVPVTITKTGVNFSGKESEETIDAVFEVLQEISACQSWLFGDFLRLCEARGITDRYRTAIEASGLSYKTLWHNYAVARRVPYELRDEALTFTHYRVIIEELIRANAINDQTPQKEISVLVKDWTKHALEASPQMTCVKLRIALRQHYSPANVSSIAPIQTPRVLTTKFQALLRSADSKELQHDVCEGVLPIISWGIKYLRETDREKLKELLSQE